MSQVKSITGIFAKYVVFLTWQSLQAANMGKQIPRAESVNPMFAEECGNICAVPAHLRCQSKDLRENNWSWKVEPEEEVQPTWMNGLNCLAHINEPALLFPPQDVVPGRCKVENTLFTHWHKEVLTRTDQHGQDGRPGRVAPSSPQPGTISNHTWLLGGWVDAAWVCKTLPCQPNQTVHKI